MERHIQAIEPLLDSGNEGVIFLLHSRLLLKLKPVKG